MTTNTNTNNESISRRHWMRHVGVGGFFALASRFGAQRAWADPSGRASGKAKRCLVLWMNGGPSQLETFDPKPGTSNGGPTEAIPTATAGIHYAANLPNVARHADRLAVLRNVTSKEGEHERAQFYMHTGFTPQPTFPRPTLGSIVSHQSEPELFPKFVSFGSRGYGPAFLGADHAPWQVGDPAESLALLRRLRTQRRALEQMSELGNLFRAGREQAVLADRQAVVRRLEQMVSTEFADALDLERESQATRDRYGDHEFGRRCLAARRMLKTGVRFVEVALDGWDTHEDNFNAVSRLCKPLDQAWSALLDDMKSDGSLDETLVVWMGDFGRTPRINSNHGRDHFPTVCPVVMAGAGVAGGAVIGKTSKNGQELDGKAWQVSDVFATILQQFGISADQEFTTSFGSPTSATQDGQLIPVT